MTEIKKQIVDELHRPARKNYTRQKTKLKGIGDLWQLDLVDVQPYSKENLGFKYILTVIDCFSKYAWAEPIKNKTGKVVADALQRIFNRALSTPINIQTDFGGEFYNAYFKKLMKTYNINHYSTYSSKKAAIVERFNRTLKEKMWRNFSLQGNYKYIDMLPNVLKTYNNTVHRTIKYKPSDVKTIDDEKNILRTLHYTNNKSQKKSPKFKVNDIVRLSKFKTVFKKQYTGSWTPELFRVQDVKNTIPTTYKLTDMNNQPILGSFYEQELQKTKYPDVYLVEKVLKKNRNKLYVKWLGLKERSWINKKDVV